MSTVVGPQRQRLLARLEEHTGSVLGMPVWASRLVLAEEPLERSGITTLTVFLLGNGAPPPVTVEYMLGSGLVREHAARAQLRGILISYHAGGIDHYKTWSIAARRPITLGERRAAQADKMSSASARAPFGEPSEKATAEITPEQRARAEMNRLEALRRRARHSTSPPPTRVQRMRMLASQAAAIERRLLIETARLATPKP